MLTKNQTILQYLINNNEKSTVTILMKLAYLIDLVSVQRNHGKVFKYNYKRYTYGPFDEKMYRDLDYLCLTGILKSNNDYTPTGNEYIVYTCNEKIRQKVKRFRVNKKDKNIINEVLDSVKGLGAKTLTEIAYKTKPMKALGATIGGNENLNKLINLNAK
jgi:uncharacterized phage-associated protein